ncbi:hypothetical protein PMG71_15010 [Roseofilum sp. BLCC_M154]|uniref:Uncharacterized protein n=2 Tax=Roseofilum TaxID=1233426 RepID=A0ABT7AV24_9CYAN|nr:hypothetical protein [Roseofilum acuticapitatum]MDJ1170740.1 hypothetical protein [Roseofilum acuticapitatum BLCC-M154]
MEALNSMIREKQHISNVGSDSEWDREEQIIKNQKAMEILKAMMDRNRRKKTTEKDLEFWRFVYETIDNHRPVGQKLFSENNEN